MLLAWVWPWALQLQHFGAEFLVGQIGRINITEILEVQRDDSISNCVEPHRRYLYGCCTQRAAQLNSVESNRKKPQKGECH